MMMKQSILSLTVLLLLAGCQSSGDKTEAEKIEQEVLAIHDEVMPRVEDIMQLKSQLNDRLDSLQKADKSASGAEIVRLKVALTEADSLMSTWMFQYNPDTLKVLEPAGAKEYLIDQKAKVEVVKEKMNSSIAEARQFLQKQP